MNPTSICINEQQLYSTTSFAGSKNVADWLIVASQKCHRFINCMNLLSRDRTVQSISRRKLCSVIVLIICDDLMPHTGTVPARRLPARIAPIRMVPVRMVTARMVPAHMVPTTDITR